MINKWKFLWRYSPDRTLEWLKKMNDSNLKLVSIKSNGTRFCFIENDMKNTIYDIDQSVKITREYLSINEDSGWIKIYSNTNTRPNIILYSKTGSEKEYLHNQSYVDNQAKKFFVRSFILLFPITILMTSFIFLMYVMIVSSNLIMYIGFLFIKFFILMFIIKYILQFILSIRYYLRMAKREEN